jgi:hypothetical protein
MKPSRIQHSLRFAQHAKDMSNAHGPLERVKMTDVEKKIVFEWENTFPADGSSVFENIPSLGLNDEQALRLRSLAGHRAARRADAAFYVALQGADWPDEKNEKAIFISAPDTGISILAEPLVGALKDKVPLADAETFLRQIGPMFRGAVNAPSARDGKKAGEDGNSDRPLLVALRIADSPELVRLLLQLGSETTWSEPPARATALGLAARLGRSASVEVLLKAGASPSLSLSVGEQFVCMPAALEAAKAGHWDLLRRLAPLKPIDINQSEERDEDLWSRTRLDNPTPRPLSGVSDAKIWLHSVSCIVRAGRSGQKPEALLREAQALAASEARPEIEAPDPAETKKLSFFARFAASKSKAPDVPVEKETPEEKASGALLAAMVAANWAVARESLDMMSERRVGNCRRAGRPLAFFAMALALAALDQEGAEASEELTQRPLARTGRIEPLAPYLSRPGRASFWRELLAYPDDTPLGKSIRAGFFEPEPSADGLRQVHWFALFNQPSGIEALAAAGADVVCDSALDDAPPPIAIAARAGCVEAMETLHRLGAPLESERTSVLLAAAENGEELVFERAAKLLLEKDVEAASRAVDRLSAWIANSGKTAPEWVARRVEALQIVVSAEQGAREAHGDAMGEPALHAKPHRL